MKIIIDLFAGAGGESCGIHEAYNKNNEKIKLFAVNHWQQACETHAANFPQDECICQDIQTIIPTDLVKPGESVELMWASPECTHFSTARGGKPMDNQSRCTPFDIIRWATMLDIKRLIIENVPEFTTWGPLNAENRPVPEERGSFFAMFINSLRGCGYDVDWRICNAADFGAPTTRKRLFIQAVKKNSGKYIIWPHPTNTESIEDDGLFSQDCRPWLSAASIIDWSIPCQPIDDRKRPLAPATMRRILNGIIKHWEKAAEPFLIRYNSGDNRHSSIHDPMPTLDTSNRYGLISPLIAEMYGTGKCRDINRPLSTVSCSGAHHAVIQPLITSIGQTSSPNRTRDITMPLSTICTKQEHCLVQPLFIPQQSDGSVKPVSRPLSTIATAGAISIVEPLIMEYYGNGQCRPSSEPLGTVTTKDRFALLNPENCRIGFRMLQPHELAAAQSFPEWYKFTGSKKDVVKQIGNAVCPKMAEALVSEYT